MIFPFFDLQKFIGTLFLLSVGPLVFAEEVTVTDSSAKSESSAPTIAESTTSSSASSDRAPYFAQIKMLTSMSTEVLDFRRDLEGRMPSFLPSTDLRSGGSVSIMTTIFDIHVLAFEGEEGFGFLTASIPIRNLKYIKNPFQLSDLGREHSQGSEFGGYRAGIEMNLFKFLDLSFAYRDLRSERLKLFEAAQYLSASIGISQTEKLMTDVAMTYKLWGERLQPKNKSSVIEYGTQNSAGLDLAFELQSKSMTQLKFGSTLQVTRVASFKVAGTNQGGGGIGSLSPYLQYALSSSITLEARYDIPIFQPLGREEIFGESSVPGLYGNALSFSIALR